MRDILYPRCKLLDRWLPVWWTIPPEEEEEELLEPAAGPQAEWTEWSAVRPRSEARVKSV